MTDLETLDAIEDALQGTGEPVSERLACIRAIVAPLDYRDGVLACVRSVWESGLGHTSQAPEAGADAMVISLASWVQGLRIERDLFRDIVHGFWKFAGVHDTPQSEPWKVNETNTLLLRLRQDRDRALALLRRLEWSAGSVTPDCPACRRWQDDGHSLTCELAALLGGAK